MKSSIKEVQKEVTMKRRAKKRSAFTLIELLVVTC